MTIIIFIKKHPHTIFDDSSKISEKFRTPTKIKQMTCPKWGGISAISTCEIGRCFQYTKPPTVAVKVTGSAI